MPNTTEISIFDQAISVRAPFAEGHTLSAIEAGVLNRVRAENVANNKRKRVKEAVEGGDDAPTMEEVLAEIKEYDKDYEFGAAATRTSRKSMTPLEVEANRLAAAKLLSLLRDAGKSKKAYTEEVGKEAVDAKIAEIASNDAIVAMAKANLKQAEKAPEVEVSL